MGKQKITMTIDEKTFNAFKELCRRRAMKVSSKVELMMQEFIEANDEPAVARKTETATNSAKRAADKRREEKESKENGRKAARTETDRKDGPATDENGGAR